MTAAIDEDGKVLRTIAASLMLVTACGRIDFAPRDDAPMVGIDDTATDSPSGAFSYTFVQGAAGDSGASSVSSKAFPNPVTAGDLVVVAFDYDAAAAVAPIQITDTVGTSFQLVGPYDNGTNHQYIGYAVLAAGGTDTISISLPTTPGSYFEIRVHEYAGAWPANPLQTSGGGTGGSLAVDGAQTPPLVTTDTDEMLFALIIFGGGGSAGTEFTLRSSLASDVTEDRLVATPGAYRGTGTMLSGTSWTACAAAFYTH